MEFTRRKFLGRALQTVGGVGVAQSFINKPFEKSNTSNKISTLKAYRGKVSLVQGMTNQSSAQFVLVIKRKQAIGYQAVDESGKLLPITFLHREERKDHDYAVEKFMVTELNVNKSYRLQVIDAHSGQLIDERFFKALDLQKARPKFIIGSCMNDIYTHGRDVMYDALVAQKPDVVFFIGDTVYADNWHAGDEYGYWDRYVQARLKLSYFRQKNLSPTIATWDDHDYGVNNGNNTFSKKDYLKSLFELFWGWEEVEGYSKGYGVSSQFEAFGQRFFLFDDRYYRDPSKTNGLHWGADQQEQALEKLSQGNSPTWLLNGSQFFGGYLGKESFEKDHSTNFKYVLNQLSQMESPFVFGSGDVHFSEVMSIEEDILGYTSFEYTSSSIHSITFPGHHLRKKNPRRLMATSAHNFLVFETELTKNTNSLLIKTESRGKESDLYFNHTGTLRRA